MTWTAGDASLITPADFIPGSPILRPRIGVPAGPGVNLATVMSDSSDATFLRAEKSSWWPVDLPQNGVHETIPRVKVVSPAPLTELNFTVRVRVANLGFQFGGPKIYVLFTSGTGQNGEWNVDTYGLSIFPDPIPLSDMDGTWYTYTGTIPQSQLDLYGVTMDEANTHLAADSLYAMVKVNWDSHPSNSHVYSSATALQAGTDTGTPATINGTGGVAGATSPGVDLPLGAWAQGMINTTWPSTSPGTQVTRPAKINGGLIHFGGIGPGQFDVVLSAGNSVDQQLFRETVTLPDNGGAFALGTPVDVDPSVWPSFDAGMANPDDPISGPYIWLEGQGAGGQVAKVRMVQVELFGEGNLVLDVAEMAGLPDPVVYPTISGDFVGSRRSFM